MKEAARRRPFSRDVFSRLWALRVLLLLLPPTPPSLSSFLQSLSVFFLLGPLPLRMSGVRTRDCYTLVRGAARKGPRRKAIRKRPSRVRWRQGRNAALNVPGAQIASVKKRETKKETEMRDLFVFITAYFATGYFIFLHSHLVRHKWLK